MESIESRRSAAMLLIAVAGALLGHVVGYGIVGVGLPELHHHLGPMVTVAFPLAAVALGAIGWRVARGSRLDFELAQGRLTLFMLGTYSLIELGERAVVAHEPSTAEMLPVLAGLLVQPLVALLLVWLARFLGDVIAAWTSPRNFGTPPGPVHLRPVAAVVRDGRRPYRGRTTRGPPRR